MENITFKEIKNWCEEKIAKGANFGVGESLHQTTWAKNKNHLLLPGNKTLCGNVSINNTKPKSIRYIDLWLDSSTCQACQDELTDYCISINIDLDSWEDCLELTVVRNKTIQKWLKKPPLAYTKEWFEMLEMHQVLHADCLHPIEESTGILQETTQMDKNKLEELIAEYTISVNDPGFSSTLLTWIENGSSWGENRILSSPAVKFTNLGLSLNTPISSYNEEALKTALLAKISNVEELISKLPQKPKLNSENYPSFAAWVKAEITHESLTLVKDEHTAFLKNKEKLKKNLLTGEKILIKIKINEHNKKLHSKGVLALLLALPNLNKTEVQTSLLLPKNTVQALKEEQLWPSCAHTLGTVSYKDTLEILETAAGLEEEASSLEAARLIHKK